MSALTPHDVVEKVTGLSSASTRTSSKTAFCAGYCSASVTVLPAPVLTTRYVPEKSTPYVLYQSNPLRRCSSCKATAMRLASMGRSRRTRPRKDENCGAVWVCSGPHSEPSCACCVPSDSAVRVANTPASIAHATVAPAKTSTRPAIRPIIGYFVSQSSALRQAGTCFDRSLSELTVERDVNVTEQTAGS